MKEFNIAFTSDIHTDFYIPAKLTGHKLEKKMEDFIENTLWLKNADILVFAGDNSHYPQQNKLMLEMIAAKKIYKKIFVTFGNHDMYLVSKKQKSTYTNSFEKLQQLKDICSEIDTVEFLDGNIVDVDGVKIGGTGMWYDFAYGYNNFGHSKSHMLQLWKDTMNDSTNIIGNDDLGFSGGGGWSSYGSSSGIKVYKFDPVKFFESEKEKMLNIIEECDVFISHIGPVTPKTLPPKYQIAENGFYYFDGEQYIMRDKAPTLWLFGHTHDSFDFKINNTHIMCNPLGYKGENPTAEVRVVDLFNLDF